MPRAAPLPALASEVRQLRALLPTQECSTHGISKAREQRVQVFCRFRGQTLAEENRGGKEAWELGEDSVSASAVAMAGSLGFSFDRVFGTDMGQAGVYSHVEPVVVDVLKGISGAVLCYGQTSAGKTFTIEGEQLSGAGAADGDLRGIIPRSLASLFNAARAEEEAGRGSFRFHVSMLEIYMERLRDLLDPESDAELRIVEDRSKGIVVRGLREVVADNLETALQVFLCGRQHRATAATGMNDRSSRSHSIFVLKAERTDIQNATIGKLCLVDLAGSECLKKACMRGDDVAAANAEIIEEAKAINQSLSTLGLVISTLASRRPANSAGVKQHVPYRSSRLTHVLKDVIGGNSQTMLVINCSSSSLHVPETVSTLRFGARARSIVNLLQADPGADASLLVQTLRAACFEIKRLHGLAGGFELPSPINHDASRRTLLSDFQSFEESTMLTARSGRHSRASRRLSLSAPGSRQCSVSPLSLSPRSTLASRRVSLSRRGSRGAALSRRVSMAQSDGDDAVSLLELSPRETEPSRLPSRRVSISHSKRNSFAASVMPLKEEATLEDIEAAAVSQSPSPCRAHARRQAQARRDEENKELEQSLAALQAENEWLRAERTQHIEHAVRSSFEQSQLLEEAEPDESADLKNQVEYLEAAKAESERRAQEAEENEETQRTEALAAHGEAASLHEELSSLTVRVSELESTVDKAQRSEAAALAQIDEMKAAVSKARHTEAAALARVADLDEVVDKAQLSEAAALSRIDEMKAALKKTQQTEAASLARVADFDEVVDKAQRSEAAALLRSDEMKAAVNKAQQTEAAALARVADLDEVVDKAQHSEAAALAQIDEMKAAVKKAQQTEAASLARVADLDEVVDKAQHSETVALARIAELQAAANNAQECQSGGAARAAELERLLLKTQKDLAASQAVISAVTQESVKASAAHAEEFNLKLASQEEALAKASISTRELEAKVGELEHQKGAEIAKTCAAENAAQCAGNRLTQLEAQCVEQGRIAEEKVSAANARAQELEASLLTAQCAADHLAQLEAQSAEQGRIAEENVSAADARVQELEASLLLQQERLARTCDEQSSAKNTEQEVVSKLALRISELESLNEQQKQVADAELRSIKDTAEQQLQDTNVEHVKQNSAAAERIAELEASLQQHKMVADEVQVVQKEAALCREEHVRQNRATAERIAELEASLQQHKMLAHEAQAAQKEAALCHEAEEQASVAVPHLERRISDLESLLEQEKQAAKAELNSIKATAEEQLQTMRAESERQSNAAAELEASLHEHKTAADEAEEMVEKALTLRCEAEEEACSATTRLTELEESLVSQQDLLAQTCEEHNRAVLTMESEMKAAELALHSSNACVEEHRAAEAATAERIADLEVSLEHYTMAAEAANLQAQKNATHCNEANVALEAARELQTEQLQKEAALELQVERSDSLAMDKHHESQASRAKICELEEQLRMLQNATHECAQPNADAPAEVARLCGSLFVADLARQLALERSQELEKSKQELETSKQELETAAQAQIAEQAGAAAAAEAVEEQRVEQAAAEQAQAPQGAAEQAAAEQVVPQAAVLAGTAPAPRRQWLKNMRWLAFVGIILLAAIAGCQVLHRPRPAASGHLLSSTSAVGEVEAASGASSPPAAALSAEVPVAANMTKEPEKAIEGHELAENQDAVAARAPQVHAVQKTGLVSKFIKGGLVTVGVAIAAIKVAAGL